MRFAILAVAVALTGCVISSLPQQPIAPPSPPPAPASPPKPSLPEPVSPDACVEDWYVQAELPSCVKDWIADLAKQQKEIAKKKAGHK